MGPIMLEEHKGGGIEEFSQETRPGTLTGIDKPYYKNAYLKIMVVYSFYLIRDPDPINLARLQDGDFNCVAQKVVEYFEDALRGQGLMPTRQQKIKELEERAQKHGATIYNVTALERILKWAIILQDIAGEVIYNSGKYQANRWKPIELIVDNGHAWGKDLHFPLSKKVCICESDVWEAINETTRDMPVEVCLLRSSSEERWLTVDQFVLQDG